MTIESTCCIVIILENCTIIKSFSIHSTIFEPTLTMMPTTNTNDYLSSLMGASIKPNGSYKTHEDTTVAARFPTPNAHVPDDDHQSTSPSTTNAAALCRAYSPAFTTHIRSVHWPTQSVMDTHPPHTLGESQFAALDTDSPANLFTPLDFANVMEDILSVDFNMESEDQP